MTQTQNKSKLFASQFASHYLKTLSEKQKVKVSATQSCTQIYSNFLNVRVANERVLKTPSLSQPLNFHCQKTMTRHTLHGDDGCYRCVSVKVCYQDHTRRYEYIQ